MALSGPTLSEQQLNDLGLNFIRPQLTSVPGTAVPYPYGGKQRQVQVDLNTAALQSKGLSPLDVVNAISAQNLILPSGTAKIGRFEYNVDMNGSPTTIAGLNNLPIKAVGGTTIYIRDVANVRDGFPPQTNIVRVDGRRSTLMTIQKIGNASTLDIISAIKKLLPSVKTTLPQDLQIRLLADQSVFVRGAISGVLREALIAACLTAVMILLFLGSWRSTLIIAISIPLSILTSIIFLSVLGETINIMTLGGLALAVGILVDDATVTIENIHGFLTSGKGTEEAILLGAEQIAVPALVSTLSICIVFVPMFLLTGVARYLFVPMAEAVVFAMLASYLLSRTLVPTMAKYLLKAHAEEGPHAPSKNPLVLFQASFERSFERIADCSSLVSAVAVFLPAHFSPCACSPLGSTLGWAKTFSHPWIAANSHCIFVPRPVCVLKRRPPYVTAWKPRFATKYRQPSSAGSSTTSDCLIAASTSPTAVRRQSERKMRTLWSPFPPSIGQQQIMCMT
jgi:multidrug efflux pump subunit AcrB